MEDQIDTRVECHDFGDCNESQWNNLKWVSCLGTGSCSNANATNVGRLECTGASSCQGANIQYGHTICGGRNACENVVAFYGGRFDCHGWESCGGHGGKLKHVELHCYGSHSCIGSLQLYASALICHSDHSCLFDEEVKRTAVVCLTPHACPSLELDIFSTCSGVGCPNKSAQTQPFVEIPVDYCSKFCNAKHNQNPMVEPEDWFRDLHKTMQDQVVGAGFYGPGWYASPAAAKSSFLFTVFGGVIWGLIWALLFWFVNWMCKRCPRLQGLFCICRQLLLCTDEKPIEEESVELQRLKNH